MHKLWKNPTRRQLLLAVLAAALALLALIWLLPQRQAGPHGETAQLREHYLRSLGHRPIPGSEQLREVRIPWEFDPLYARYNALQQAVGMDLRPHRGRTALLCTWRLEDSPARAELLVRKGTVIGGSLYEPGPGGRVRSLAEKIQ